MILSDGGLYANSDGRAVRIVGPARGREDVCVSADGEWYERASGRVWGTASDAGALIAEAAPNADAAEALALRLKALAARRWRATQRFVFDGVETDASPAIAVVTAAVVAMQIAGGQGEKLWKLANGEYRTFNLAALITFGQAIEAHVQACFEHEAALAAELTTAAEDSAAAVLAVDLEAGWP